MARSLWKGPFCEIIESQQKIWSRRSIILPQFIGKQLFIHNGKNFISLKVNEDMVGHRLGEFATSRRKPIHKKKSTR
jgi:small subunit ribosomal protein S19